MPSRHFGIFLGLVCTICWFAPLSDDPFFQTSPGWGMDAMSFAILFSANAYSLASWLELHATRAACAGVVLCIGLPVVVAVWATVSFSACVLMGAAGLALLLALWDVSAANGHPSDTIAGTVSKASPS